MTTIYPTTYAAPLIAGLTMQVASGVVRSDVPGAQVQRRVFKTMPHTYMLSFAMSLADWADWQAWVAQYAHGWFSIYLPGMYAGLSGNTTAPTLIRFISPVTSVNLAQDKVQLSVMAEIAPSMISKFHENT